WPIALARGCGSGCTPQIRLERLGLLRAADAAALHGGANLRAARASAPRSDSPGSVRRTPHGSNVSGSSRLRIVHVIASQLRLARPLALIPGGMLEEVEIAYRVHGAADAPVILVLGGISAGRHVTSCADDPAPGWWERTVGDGRAIDTARFRVLTLDYVC